MCFEASPHGLNASLPRCNPSGSGRLQLLPYLFQAGIGHRFRKIQKSCRPDSQAKPPPTLPLHFGSPAAPCRQSVPEAASILPWHLSVPALLPLQDIPQCRPPASLFPDPVYSTAPAASWNFRSPAPPYRFPLRTPCQFWRRPTVSHFRPFPCLHPDKSADGFPNSHRKAPFQDR